MSAISSGGISPAARYAQELWAKIDLPLAMAAMILIAAPFVFGPLRTRGTGQRMMIGAMIGIVFSLIQQITIYLGQLLNVSPALTATVPSVALLALALYLFRRARVAGSALPTAALRHSSPAASRKLRRIVLR